LIFVFTLFDFNIIFLYLEVIKIVLRLMVVGEEIKVLWYR